MIHRKLLMATAILASVAITACSDTTAPNALVQTEAPPGTKQCLEFTGGASDFCSASTGQR